MASAISELCAPESRQPAKLSDVDQAHCGVHDHCAQCGGREGREQWTQAENGEDGGGHGEEAGELCASTRRLPDCRSAATAADREALHHAGSEIRGAERQQLPLGVDAFTASVRERAPSQDVVGVSDECDAQRRWDQGHHTIERHVRKRRDRKPDRNRADDRDTTLAQVQ